MGGGMAAVAAGSHPSAVSTAFLMDPVDWNLESSRVDSQFLTRYSCCYICIGSAFLMIMKSVVIALYYTGLCVCLPICEWPALTRLPSCKQ